MTLEEAKILLQKSLKDMTAEEVKLLPEAIKIVANSWAKQL